VVSCLNAAGNSLSSQDMTSWRALRGPLMSGIQHREAGMLWCCLACLTREMSGNAG
jgi:hypothetical protein